VTGAMARGFWPQLGRSLWFSIWLSLRRSLPLSLALCLTLALPSSVKAHAGDATGFASITISGNVVRYTYTPTATASADPEKLPVQLRQHLRVTADGKPCLADRYDALAIAFQCAHAAQQISVEDHLAQALGDNHHVIALFTWNGGSQSHSFSTKTPTAVVQLSATSALVSTSAASFFPLGVEHIATGYDHLLFLLALILCGGNLKSLVKIITAFTVAHSITLGAAALGLVSLPSALVESVIALSIAYVAFENLFPRCALSRRWMISFAFGLIHGFGFSSVLQEIGLPRDNLVWALLNFNLGVEAGQLVAVLIAIPALLWLKKQSYEQRVIRGLSWLVMLAGLSWFIERLMG
jgi:hydrogenase/urease accessory protein HupE